MTRILRTGLVAAVTAVAMSSAFASGYGPAPFYRPYTGAPSSQRGPGAHADAAERMDNRVAYATDTGGVNVSTSESGAGVPSSGQAWTYRHH
jgi:hypothetical protein